MPTVLEIKNRALARLGQDKITDEGATTVVPTLLRDHYDSCRLQLLRSHPWNFAMKREPLTQDNDQPAFGPRYRYVLPPGYVSVVKAAADSEGFRRIDSFTVEHGYLMTYSETAYLLYVFDYDDPDDWDYVFTEAVVCLLASRVAVPLGRSDLQGVLIQELEQVVLPKANLFNAWEDRSNENNPVMQFINEATINRMNFSNI